MAGFGWPSMAGFEVATEASKIIRLSVFRSLLLKDSL
jgi:hypothetical protein